MNKKILNIVQSALIASLYVVLTYISNVFGLANGIIQIRISEALTILPIFTPAAISGLFVGCIISSILTNCAIYDVIFGSLATLLGAYGTLLIKNICQNKENSKTTSILATIPTIIANTLIIPWILAKVYNLEGSILYFTVTIFISEVISAGIGGYFLAKALESHKDQMGWK